MNEFKISDLNRILERDATDTTYKFALLRALAYVCQRFSHFSIIKDGRVWLPTGLLVERWLAYYYPLIGSEDFIPQKNAEKDLDKPGLKIAFRAKFRVVTDYYSDKGGFSTFWVGYRKDTVPHEINLSCLELAKAIWYQIIRYPMKHLGYSVSQKYYSLIKYEKRKIIYNNSTFCQDLLINDFGLFSISEDFYQTLLLLGAYISGEYSIINKWIDFSVNADSSGKIQPRTVFELLNISPESERVVLEAKQFYEKIIYKNGEIECVWSGQKIHSVKDLHIDHMIPFSLWQNNDLWNLLPSHKKVNALKRDMVPSLILLESRKNRIIQYWTELDKAYHDRFMKEVSIALTGTKTADNSWDSIFNQLVEKCQYLIETRGLSEWALE